MGAATALNAAARSPDVDAVVADSAFATLTNIASNSITHFTDLPPYPFGPLSVTMAGWMVGKDVAENAPVRAVATASAPVLVIQGADDVIAFPDTDGRAIAQAAPLGSEMWLVPGAAHVQAHHVATREYEARVLAFLEERLSD
jgi:pimeloyl-ACP methyl ester carboxylesterase